MDSDDISHPDRLKEQLKILIQKDADVCGCSYFSINNKSIILNEYIMPTKQYEFPIQTIKECAFLSWKFISKNRNI